MHHPGRQLERQPPHPGRKRRLCKERTRMLHSQKEMGEGMGVAPSGAELLAPSVNQSSSRAMFRCMPYE